MDARKPSNPKPAARPAAKQGGAKQGAKKAKPGDGLLGWLGRQIGHVSKAVKTDVTKPAAKATADKVKAAAKPKSAGESRATTSQTVLYRENKVEEAVLPDRPGVILRRTIIDEVVVDPASANRDAGEKPTTRPKKDQP